VFTDWRYFLGFGFGSGLLPKIPGTWGSLMAIPLILLLKLSPVWCYCLFVVVYFLLGTWLSDVLSKQLGIHDYGGVNCDEILGMLIVMAPFNPSFMNLAVAFALFRFFDILKPFPVGWIDKHVHGGFGMMLDDVAAALLAMIFLYIWVVI